MSRPAMASILEEQQQRWARQRPLFERVQDWASRHKRAGGVPVFRVLFFALLVIGVILFYTGTQFYGLRDAEAMNLGQLARHLRAGHGYVTSNIRPSDLFHLEAVGKPTLSLQRVVIPELWTPPVYPWVLSWGLRAMGDTDHPKETMGGDRTLMLAGWTFFIAGLTLTYLLGRELFDGRVALLATVLYLFCNPLLDHAIAGLPTGLLSTLFLLTVYGLFKAEQWQQAGRSLLWVNTALGVSTLALGLGILTDYPFAALIVPFVVYVGLTFGRRQCWRKCGLVLALLAVVLAPWIIRNYRQSRTLFGLAHYSVIEGTGRKTDHEIREGQLQRSYAPAPAIGLRSVGREVLMNIRQLYEDTSKADANYLMVFFLVSVLHRFRRDEVFRLRRLLFWGLLMYVLWFSATGVPQRNPLIVFIPLVILYAAAFFYVLFERLQLRTRGRRAGMVLLFAGINVVPFGLAILPPRDTMPYPPYAPEVARSLGEMFSPAEVLASDMPWATAWYAQRSTVWTPVTESDYQKIHLNVHNIAGLYLTQMTMTEFMSLDLLRNQERAQHQQFWVAMLRTDLRMEPPASFPLRRRRPLTPDSQQVLVTNRPI